MSTADKLWILSAYEFRLLVRSRGRLLWALGLPLAGAGLCGFAGSSAMVYGIFAVLLASALLVARPVLSRQMIERFRGGPGLGRVSGALAGLVILAAQAGLYTAIIALFRPESLPGSGMLLSALAFSLIVLAIRLYQPGR